jgi:hypothetical protein
MKPYLRYLLFFVLGMALPAAGLISAAGGVDGRPPASTGPGQDFPETLQLDYFIYTPFVPHHWPPLPAAPTLEPIRGPVLDAPYLLTWSASEVAPDGPVLFYTIEEAETSEFVETTTYTTTDATTTWTITPTLGTYGTFYYRVRAHNAWGVSPWSNVRYVTVYTRWDDFLYPGTDWRARRTSAPDIDLMNAYYIEGDLETYVRDMFDFAIFSPMLPAPSLPYTIELKTRVRHKVNEVSYGIVFGGDPGDLCRVERADARKPEGCFTHYYRLNVIWAGNYLKFNINRVDGHDERGRGISEELRGFDSLVRFGWDPADWHRWTFEVHEDGFALYVNDQYIAWIPDNAYVDMPYYGIFSSTFEYNNAHFQHDYFHVVAMDPAAVSLSRFYRVE